MVFRRGWSRGSEQSAASGADGGWRARRFTHRGVETVDGRTGPKSWLLSVKPMAPVTWRQVAGGPGGRHARASALALGQEGIAGASWRRGRSGPRTATYNSVSRCRTVGRRRWAGRTGAAVTWAAAPSSTPGQPHSCGQRPHGRRVTAAHSPGRRSPKATPEGLATPRKATSRRDGYQAGGTEARGRQHGAGRNVDGSVAVAPKCETDDDGSTAARPRRPRPHRETISAGTFKADEDKPSKLKGTPSTISASGGCLSAECGVADRVGGQVLRGLGHG